MQGIKGYGDKRPIVLVGLIRLYPNLSDLIRVPLAFDLIFPVWFRLVRLR
jgi:hypothetical protein